MANGEHVPVLDSARLRTLFDGVNAFGRCTETGGFNRPAFSEADMAARHFLAAQMAATGLAVRWDGAGNVFGRWGNPDGASIMAGSHLDTVPAGGAFDGALGVCVALESIRAMQQAGIKPAVPVEVVATSDEEGRFGGMLGSQAIAGQVSRQWIAHATDADGVQLTEAMAARDLDPFAILDAARPAGSIRGFLELHIEQGPCLATSGTTVGIVNAISGVCNWQITLTGVANHSGTTPMDMRADAFAGLAEIAATIPALIRSDGGVESRVTVGKVDLAPNFPHTIPGKAVFNLIIRDPHEPVMSALAAAFRALIARVAQRHRLAAAIDEMSWLAPVVLDADLAAMVAAQAERLDITFTRMPSGAGHDAQTMQAVCPSALIFVPSRGGISHAPAEWTEWADIERGAALYLAALVKLTDG